MESQPVLEKIKWGKGLWNGILAWLAGFFLFLIPGFILGFKMGFELGPKSDNPQKLGELIGSEISAMYQENDLIKYGFILITSLLIFWRAKSVSKNTGSKKINNGLIVSIFPLLFSLLLILNSGFYITGILQLILFPLAAYLGGKYSKQEFNQVHDVHVQTSH